jgi:hypothetical protein
LQHVLRKTFSRFHAKCRAIISDAILTPELVSLRAVLGIAVGYNVSAEAASDDEDPPHLVMREVFLVPFYVIVMGSSIMLQLSQK